MKVSQEGSYCNFTLRNDIGHFSVYIYIYIHIHIYILISPPYIYKINGKFFYPNSDNDKVTSDDHFHSKIPEIRIPLDNNGKRSVIGKITFPICQKFFQ
jgi:hypothetical protein